jgi:DNA-binding transcriptional LysR family regulator
MPAEPEALMAHDTLRLLERNGEPEVWRLSRGDARWEGRPPARTIANVPEMLLRLARAGAGIVGIGRHFAAPYVRADELVPVLPEWRLPSATAWAVFPGRRLMPARTRVFLDALAEEFDTPECRAQSAEAQ